MKIFSSQSTNKLDENHPPRTNNNSKRKRENKANVRCRKARLKHQLSHESDVDEQHQSTNESKRSRSSFKDYQSTLDELHMASKTFHDLNQNQPIENERFNKSNLTKLSHDNLILNHFPHCSFEQDDQQFFKSINTYLDEFRERLVEYFYYMKSDIYREHIRKQLTNEIELNEILKTKVNSLEHNIKHLLNDAICLIKTRTNDLGLEQLTKPIELITCANNISTKHKDLRQQVATLEKQIENYNQENQNMNLILDNFSSEPDTYSKLTIDIQQGDNQQTSILISPNSVEEKHSDCQQSNLNSFVIFEKVFCLLFVFE